MVSTLREVAQPCTCRAIGLKDGGYQLGAIGLALGGVFIALGKLRQTPGTDSTRTALYRVRQLARQ